MTFIRSSLVRSATPAVFLPFVATIARAQDFQCSLDGNADSGFSST